MRLAGEWLSSAPLDAPAVVVLHGLFGSRHDWLGIARRLTDTARFFLLDLPNHGDSPRLDPFLMDTTAKAVMQTLAAERIEKPFLLGHSLGGKIALTLVRDNPDAFAHLILGDISPRKIQPLHLFPLRACRRLDLATPGLTRQTLDASLACQIPDPLLRHYLLKNLVRDQEGYFWWRIPLDVLERDTAIVTDAVEFPTPSDVPATLIAGGKSAFSVSRDLPLLKHAFQSLTLHTLPNAGHMIQADAPAEVADILRLLLAPCGNGAH